MKAKLAAVCLVSAAFLGPICRAADKRKPDNDMQRAIAWEHYKDQAAARQARLEARHPSVTNPDRSANRETDDSGRKVTDPGPRTSRKDKK